MSYHPTLGRFVQRDPAGYVDGVNTYEYLKGNPPTHRDPQGTQTMPSPTQLSDISGEDFTMPSLGPEPDSHRSGAGSYPRSSLNLARPPKFKPYGNWIDCFSDCIEKDDFLTGGEKAALVGAGAPIPKWMVGQRAIWGSSYFTTILSWASMGTGTAVSGANVARNLGRGASRANTIYGRYLAVVELSCATECWNNDCAY